MFRETELQQLANVDIVPKVPFRTLYSSTKFALTGGQIVVGQY